MLIYIFLSYFSYLQGDYICDCNIVWYIRQAKDKIMDEDSIRCNNAIPGNLSYNIITFLEPKDVCPQKGINGITKQQYIIEYIF